MVRLIDERYTLFETPIASGGMADVYKAVDSKSEEMPQVAVKLLRLDESHEALVSLFFEARW